MHLSAHCFILDKAIHHEQEHMMNALHLTERTLIISGNCPWLIAQKIREMVMGHTASSGLSKGPYCAKKIINK